MKSFICNIRKKDEKLNFQMGFGRGAKSHDISAHDCLRKFILKTHRSPYRLLRQDAMLRPQKQEIGILLT